MRMHNPPHPGEIIKALCLEPLGLSVTDAAKALGLSHRDIVSGAAHDAVYLSRVAPSAMIFVPCEGGISHNEIENARPQDPAAGCSVLLHAVLATARS